MLRGDREQARRDRRRHPQGPSGGALRLPDEVPREPSLALRPGPGRASSGSKHGRGGAGVPAGARAARLRPGRCHVRAGGRGTAGSARRDDLLRRELHRRPPHADAHRGARKLQVDARRLRHLLERLEGKRARRSPGPVGTAWGGERAGGAGDGRRSARALGSDLVGRDHRRGGAGGRHAGEAGRDRLARTVGALRKQRPPRPLSRRPRPSPSPVGVRRAAASPRGPRARGALSMREVLARHRVDLILFLGSLAAYALSSDGLLAHQSLAPHFVYQADAFLHGQLALSVPRPPNLNDWVLRDGRWYVSFPPFPALVMMPFVALFGLSFNDVTFTLFFSAANVALLYRLLRRIQPDRAEWEHVAFALIYGFGTLAWSCGIRGEVWYTAETIGVTLTLLYLHASLGARHPILAGLAVACAAITRAPLAFSAVFFLFEALSPDGPLEWDRLRDPARWRAALPKLVPHALAIGVVAIPMAWMNYARFGSFGEFGHSHLYANRVNEQVRRDGLFHSAFLERKL